MEEGKGFVIRKERCKSCKICVHFCPKKALYISDEINSSGYKVVKVSKEKCTGCGICFLVCPDLVFVKT